MTTTDVIKARQGKKVRDMDPIEAQEKILDVVTKCHLARGTRATAEDNVISAKIIYDQLMRDFPKVTIEEFDLAANEALFSGVKTYGCSPVEMIKWLKDYGESEVYKQARWEEGRVAPKYQLEGVHTMSDEEAAQQLLRKDYDAMMKGIPHGFRFSYPRGTLCYDYLSKVNEIASDAWRANIGRARECIRKAEMAKGFEQLSVVDDEVIMAKAITIDDYLKERVNKTRRTIEAMDDLPE